MDEATRRIVIIGGGSAGWITASLIAADHRNSVAGAPEIVLIESPDVPTIGVGEGTWPTMRATLQRIGVSEVDLIRECNASFKQGTEFRDWSDTGASYYHPFSIPPEYAILNLAAYWLAHADRIPFAEFVTHQASVIAGGLAPKQPEVPDYAFAVNYAYHFDASNFADFLHRHAVDNLDVQYISGNVERVDSQQDGNISAVVLSTGEIVAGDLFVDCTGQRALLIGEHFGVDLVSVKDTLFNDAAIAVQVPYAAADDAIASVTRSTALDSGWVWDIGLQSRRGIGYAHSTAHVDETAAMTSIHDYVRRTSPGVDVDGLTFRSLRFEPGYRQEIWVKNCVAVGLSAGFVEPLEASAIALIEQSASFISRQLPRDDEAMRVVARRFNEKMLYHWKRVIEFLKLHYFISKRSDSAYWHDNRLESTCPEELRDKLILWQQQPPWHDDAPRVDELFPSASYQYVLYGMGFRPKYPASYGADFDRVRVRIDKLLHANAEKARQLGKLLPTNRELINAMISVSGIAA